MRYVWAKNRWFMFGWCTNRETVIHEIGPYSFFIWIGNIPMPTSERFFGFRPFYLHLRTHFPWGKTRRQQIKKYGRKWLDHIPAEKADASSE